MNLNLEIEIHDFALSLNPILGFGYNAKNFREGVTWRDVKRLSRM